MGKFKWSHNAYYQRFLIRQLPTPCTRVLDVGCGAGAFAGELARRAEHVDAIDRSAVMIDAAQQAVPENVRCILGDVLEQPLPDRTYDAIVSISTLHHMPLEEVLPVLARALRPGGVIAAVALPRPDLVRELPVELVAAIGQRVLGMVFRILRARGQGSWYAVEQTHDVMPVVLDPPLTTRQVRARVAAVLPGARVRRLVFWRYSLVWRKPA
ncbi:class I SAM-dependent methyltransferase [Nocardia pseudovaccinii]|uniref:class I SAM-dependent methyltransferase n=1 Tax=Nocardia pseudovaccinii TaxID=189540 RepID=UPI0007A3B4C5|nr:class I SAM-dependent methyltransferase [Nocardia pseudovaccinii]